MRLYSNVIRRVTALNMTLAVPSFEMVSGSALLSCCPGAHWKTFGLQSLLICTLPILETSAVEEGAVPASATLGLLPSLIQGVLPARESQKGAIVLPAV
jgi:hypothetical protein